MRIVKKSTPSVSCFQLVCFFIFLWSIAAGHEDDDDYSSSSSSGSTSTTTTTTTIDLLNHIRIEDLQGMELTEFEKAQSAGRNFAIPGTTQTIKGYDTEFGTDAICWKSQGSTAEGDGNVDVDENKKLGSSSIAFPNELIEDYQLSGRVELLQACPGANALTATAPDELRVHGERLRTGVEYNYPVSLEIDVAALTKEIFAPINNINNNNNNNTTTTNTTTIWNNDDNIPDMMIVADRGEGYVAVQVVICELGRSGFCSPFIHEESDARLASLGIAESPDYGERHGNSHVHSKYSIVQVISNSNNNSTPGRVVTVPVEVSMKVNDPGTFFAVAAVQLFLKVRNSTDDDNDNNNIVYRYDMANALTQPFKYIRYQDPAKILTVTDAVRVFTYVLIGCSSSIVLYLLLCTIRYRDHQVFKLTQGYFLIGFLLAALTASVSSFLLDPRNDAYCRSGPFLVITSLHYMVAVNIGRLWRINTVISPLLTQAMKKSKQSADDNSWWERCTKYSMQLADRLCNAVLALFGRQLSTVPETREGCADTSNHSNRRKSKARNLRKQVTCKQLAMVIAIFSIPQLVIQVFALILQTPYSDIQIDDDESKGRVFCSSGTDLAHDISMYGAYYFIFVLILLLAMALATRKLPSLLNETVVILESTITSICLLFLGVGVLAITNGPTTSPSLRYLVKVIVSNSFALGSSIRIILPKLHIIWSGETIVVSKLVSDSASSNHSSNKGKPVGSSLLRNVSGLSLPRGEMTGITFHGSNMNGTNDPGSSVPRGSTTNVGSEITYTSEVNSPQNLPEVEDNRVSFVVEENMFSEDNRTKNCSKEQRPSIQISQATSPDREFVLKLVATQEKISNLSHRIMSGMVVPKEEWMEVRNICKELGQTFEHDVEFAWERMALVDESSSHRFLPVEEDFDSAMIGNIKTDGLSTLNDEEEAQVERNNGLKQSHGLNLRRLSDGTSLPTSSQAICAKDTKDTDHDSASSQEFVSV